MTKYKRVLLMTSPKAPIGTSPLHYGDFRPPLGLGFLAAALRNNGHIVLIVDNYLMEHDTDKILEDFRPDYIGIYVHTASYKMALKLIERLRNLTNVPIVCGGPHATFAPESFSDSVNHIVLGEGEKAIIDIVSGNNKNRIIMGNRFSSSELDQLSWPDYADFHDKPYNWRLDIFGSNVKKVFSMNTSRGCPFRCRFCAVNTFSGRRYRIFSAEKIIDEIVYLKKTYDIDGVYFREDNFTASSNRLKKFCNLLIDRKLNIIWACESRVDAADRKMLELMYKSGCRGLYIGVESGSQRVLDNMCKDVTVNKITAFFNNCFEVGIGTYATFCFGTPGETEEDRQETERIIEIIKPTRIDRFVYTGVPRSEFYDYILEKKLYYYKDENGFVYPNAFRELALRYYGKDDPRFIP